MVKEGIPFIVLFFVPAVILALLGLWIGAGALLLLAAFMAFFFRDPTRIPPNEPGIVVSPADGRVLVVEKAEPGDPNSATQISIFLSPLDVHINRCPIGGEIVGLDYKPGAFHVASRKIASVENEQNIVTVRGSQVTIVFRQIAGILARRLVFWKRVGDHVDIGERIGLMKFSSRMDVIMPAEVQATVTRGNRVVGGVTIIGRLRDQHSGQHIVQPGDSDG